MVWIIEIVANLFGYAVAKDAQGDRVMAHQVATMGCFVGIAVCAAALWFVFWLLG